MRDHALAWRGVACRGIPSVCLCPANSGLASPPCLHTAPSVPPSYSLSRPHVSLTPSLPDSLTHSLARSPTHSLTHPPTHSLTHSLTHSPCSITILLPSGSLCPPPAHRNSCPSFHGLSVPRPCPVHRPSRPFLCLLLSRSHPPALDRELGAACNQPGACVWRVGSASTADVLRLDTQHACVQPPDTQPNQVGKRLIYDWPPPPAPAGLLPQGYPQQHSLRSLDSDSDPALQATTTPNPVASGGPQSVHWCSRSSSGPASQQFSKPAALGGKATCTWLIGPGPPPGTGLASGKGDGARGLGHVPLCARPEAPQKAAMASTGHGCIRLWCSKCEGSGRYV